MYVHTWKSEVKDSELDSLGVVNNANYFIYCEHARHLYAKSLGFPFSSFLVDGYSMLIFRSEMDYKKPLVADDEFMVETKFEVKRSRLLMEQHIRRVQDNQLILQALFQGTGIKIETGRPALPPRLVAAIHAANEL